ncbi:MAG: hypothetical protein AB7S26_20645 [Sandaracinaceae bacterium]
MRLLTFGWVALVVGLAGCNDSMSASDAGDRDMDAGSDRRDSGPRPDAGGFDAGASDGSIDDAGEPGDGALADGGGGGGDGGRPRDGGATDMGVRCGASVCARGQVCCTRPGGAGSCMADAMTCSGGIVLGCDGPEDCSGGQACCAALTTDGINGARCLDAAMCTAPMRSAICHDASSCASGEMCCPSIGAIDGLCAATCG